MRRALVAANWKMHGRAALIGGYVSQLARAAESARDDVEVLLCPPTPYLGAAAAATADTDIALGAQDCSYEEEDGAFTGEASAAMLADAGCGWVLVGHSERRRRWAESDALVAAKFRAVQGAGLKPILCVGETEGERADGRAESRVLAQLAAVMERCEMDQLGRAALAYEPVWAIGSGQAASPADAQSLHAALRAAVAERDRAAARRIRILYGGSVSGANAGEFFAQPDIDGALVGGASLDAGTFSGIVAAAREVRHRQEQSRGAA
ncbi:MAG TPA: triose-phosphate isomerase [Gammaproteobacteria bacterium]|nr:triose-phosphate isomerase [Gammaproteobacteria bacterium]